MDPLGRRLTTITGIASIVFTVGTALHAFVIVDDHTLTRMMVLANADPAAAEQFLTVFRAVGCLYIVANALGVLAFRPAPPRWLLPAVLVTNVTQAAGVFMVPPQMWQAAVEHFGPVGTLPSAITDGGAFVLAAAITVTIVRARKKPAQRS
ncbi:hypothetical protein [Lentzea guizhouensis]|uniref:hypothetical protein n=1 Tax=Lentzea guizhouensis TaxID=1586287 RepID=UPI0009F631C5|nr:hypothetical protein [Lentzea guizhouensis]